MWAKVGIERETHLFDEIQFRYISPPILIFNSSFSLIFPFHLQQILGFSPQLLFIPSLFPKGMCQNRATFGQSGLLFPHSLDQSMVVVQEGAGN
jgi:hypothetical protein